MLKQQVQTALRVLFPPSCAGCNKMVDSEFGLCGPCWRQLPLIAGPVCHDCGVPLLVASSHDVGTCDDCRKLERPWSAGRAAMRYTDLGRKLVLGLKHGDRQDVAITASAWLARAGQPLLEPETLIVPVPLHWTRLVKRRYNQSALLAQHLALKTQRNVKLDALQRIKKTQALETANVDERFARLSGAITASPKGQAALKDRPVILIDDVMTSGATLTAATNACLDAGARRVDVLVLARVCKDD